MHLYDEPNFFPLQLSVLWAVLERVLRMVVPAQVPLRKVRRKITERGASVVYPAHSRYLFRRCYARLSACCGLQLLYFVQASCLQNARTLNGWLAC